MDSTETTTHAAVEELDAIVAASGGPSWLQELRKVAADKFKTSQWPRTSEEEWRRTNLSPFEFGLYQTLPAAEFAATEGTAHVSSQAPRAGVLRYENDRLTFAQLSERWRTAGVTFGDVCSFAPDHPIHAVAEKELRSFLENADNRLQYWNLALAQGVTVLYVPRNVAVDEPFEIDVNFAGDEKIAAPLTVIVAETGAEVSVIRRISSNEDEGEMLVVDGECVVAADNARVKYVVLERMNDESLYFHNADGSLARDAVVHRTEAALGADFVKTRFVCTLAGPGSDAIVNGIYFAQDEQHMDIRTVQKHRSPNAMSRAFYRGAVRDEAHAIYQGLIDVAAKAPGTDAYLTNKNLILTEEARADSIPSLNIKTDDVRCSHGSTTGKLDPGQIYYLQTRGYSKREAQRTLVEGYFEDLVTQVPEDLQDEIRELIAVRIP